MTRSTRVTAILALAAICLQIAPRGHGETPQVPDTLSLQTTLEYALESNFDIRLALEAIREQEGLIVEIRARALPRVSLNASYSQVDEGLTDTIGGLFPAREENWSITLAARQTLYEGGGVRAALDAQKLAQESVLLALETTISDALLEVRTRYYSALLAREQIEVESLNIQLLEETLQNARNRREAGEASDFEVLRSEVLLANAKAPLIRAQGDYRVAIDQLRQSMGYQNYRRDPSNLEKVPELTDELAYRPFDYDLQQSLRTALSERSEIKQLAAAAKAREAGLTIARSSGLPKVELVGTYGKQRATTSGSFDDGPEGWTLGLEASWSLWDGAETRGRRLQARSQLERARLEEDAVRLAVEVQVRQAISALREADQLAQSAVRVVDQALEALRLANNRLEAGAISDLDVLEARVALTEARTNALAANFQHLVAAARYRRAIGEEPFSRAEG